jgi:hypothetical protein
LYFCTHCCFTTLQPYIKHLICICFKVLYQLDQFIDLYKLDNSENTQNPISFRLWNHMWFFILWHIWIAQSHFILEWLMLCFIISPYLTPMSCNSISITFPSKVTALSHTH